MRASQTRVEQTASLTSLSSPKSSEKKESPIFYDPVITSIISTSSRHSIYEAKCNKTGESFAMKIFQYNEGSIDKKYLIEKRAKAFDHQNVIAIKESVDKKISTHENGKTTFFVSYLLMELGICDFFDIMKVFERKDDVLARTFFHQLIAGIEHIHSKGFAHLDLKLENILLGNDFKLKITDFDLAFKRGDDKLHGSGTENFRAPELKGKAVSDPFACDIYAAAIILFVLRTGHLPYCENKTIRGYDLEELMFSNPKDFWKAHGNFINYQLEKSFQNLFCAMTQYNPGQRISLKEIKKDVWYNGPTYSREELEAILGNSGL